MQSKKINIREIAYGRITQKNTVKNMVLYLEMVKEMMEVYLEIMEVYLEIMEVYLEMMEVFLEMKT